MTESFHRQNAIITCIEMFDSIFIQRVFICELAVVFARENQILLFLELCDVYGNKFKYNKQKRSQLIRFWHTKSEILS